MSERPPLRVPIERLSPGVIVLPSDATRYAIRVHRLQAGDRFLAFDPETATEAEAEIVAVDRRSCHAKIDEPRPATNRPTRSVTLVQALGKADKMDAVIRDATELGAARVVPVIAERTIGRPSAADAMRRAARYRRIAIQAARQCQRGDAPIVDAPTELTDAIEALVGTSAALICLDPRGTVTFRAALERIAPDRAIVLFVGPEGGFSASELASMDRASIARATLGPLVLRTETVCAAALGAVLVHAGA